MTDHEPPEPQTRYSDIPAGETVNSVTLSSIMKIVVLSMASVMACLAIALVVVVANERSTQTNANRQEEINEDLRIELECLRIPAFEADRADSRLAIITARGLAAVATGNQDVLVSLADDLNVQADVLEAALLAREESLTECDIDHSQDTPTTEVVHSVPPSSAPASTVPVTTLSP